MTTVRPLTPAQESWTIAHLLPPGIYINKSRGVILCNAGKMGHLLISMELPRDAIALIQQQWFAEVLPTMAPGDVVTMLRSPGFTGTMEEVEQAVAVAVRERGLLKWREELGGGLA